MTDNMLLLCYEPHVIKHLTASFFYNRKEIFERIRTVRYTFLLNNPDNMTGSQIRIESIGYGKFLKIKGSLRKWYFAEQDSKDSFEDFTQPEFDNALKMLLSLLEIPDEMRVFFYVSSLEIGLTVPVKETCRVINKMICGFKSAHYKPTYPEEECIKYSTEDVNFKVYNKALEISRGIKKKPERERFLSSIGEKNYFRLELKIKGGKHAIEKRFKICNLEELVNNLNQFYLYFLNEIEKKLKVSAVYAQEPIFDLKGKSPGEIMNCFKIWGIYHSGKDTNWIARQSNDPKETRRAIAKALENAPFREGSYDKESLLDDIKEQMVRMIDRQMALEEKVEKIPPKKNKKNEN